MCAYNAINGQPACANEFLLEDQLRGKWGFQGYVVSDCGAVLDIFTGHHYRPTQAQASAISLERGMDNECADFSAKVKDDHDYKPYVDAVQQGYLRQSAMDTALIRLFTARMKLGMFDPPEMVPYTKIDEKELDSAEHRALARKLANESMVLLKNDGALAAEASERRSRSSARWPTRRVPDRQLQRDADAHGFRAGRAESRVSNAKFTYVPGHAVPAQRRRRRSPSIC